MANTDKDPADVSTRCIVRPVDDSYEGLLIPCLQGGEWGGDRMVMVDRPCPPTLGPCQRPSRRLVSSGSGSRSGGFDAKGGVSFSVGFATATAISTSSSSAKER